MEQRTKPLSWRKRLTFNLMMTFAVYAFIEMVSLGLIIFNHGSFTQFAERRRAAAAQNPFQPGGLLEAPFVIHPYVGNVLQPKDDGGELTIDGRYRITEFGFVDDDLPIHKRAADRLIVAIVGGSVARQMALNATQILAEELSRVPEFAGRTYKFVRIANSGYKQPQQLMTLNYLLMLGAEFDVVINLDGFNEAALPGIDNTPHGIFAAFPRDWGKLVASNTSPEFTRMGGYVSYLRTLQRDEALRAEAFPWSYSPLFQLVWNYRQQQCDHAIHRQIVAMGRLTERETTYCASGPPQHFRSEQEMYSHFAEIWSRSSTLIREVCEARGIRYFHFLQPNQYVEGSKPIGTEEAMKAVQQNIDYAIAVRACFPLMKAEGSHLAANGEAFFDLTDAFADHPEPIYVDTCCHITKSGDLIMARSIGERIRRHLGAN